jgi:Matrixin
MNRPLAIACVFLLAANPAFAYLKFGVPVGGRQVTLKWAQTPVRYVVSSTSVPGVTTDDFLAAVGRAFKSWQDVPTATISFQLAGITDALPGRDDGLSTLGFLNRPELDRVLASTSYVVDASTGALVESDIFFNSSFAWSVAPNGEPNRFDVESIALHEIGHFFGLGHSALGETELREGGGRRVISSEAIMFPIAFAAGSIAGRTLKADDIAGISDLYPEPDFAQASGTISGRVTKNGAGVFGAHVVAFDPATGAMVGNFSLNAQGQFSIAALTPGPRVIRVEPLDDADVDSFFDASRGTDLDFSVRFYERVVVVPRGGDSGEVEVKVVRK